MSAGLHDEWRLHHQGGITGYAWREVIATPASDVEIEAGQAFAWNPSITGAKTRRPSSSPRTGRRWTPAPESRSVEVV